ncbi:methyltransferase domain protein [Ceratobasidium sp. AG-Ba]|nr:methyltransferase domain protein [Ceratobasidium sp. AG-Ba]QRW11217.1 methyltransferase domain protein [Ceratobasidium sp. AG-Ba]
MPLFEWNLSTFSVEAEDNDNTIRVYEESSNSESPAFSDSDCSYCTMSTLQSEEVASYFRSVSGFTYSSNEDVPILIPTDTNANKLDVLLHIIVRLCQGGRNVPCEVDEMLRKGGVDSETGARVLDIVTNSGTWVEEMADTYPTAGFTSIDVKPLVPHKPHARIGFQVYNLHAGIMEPDATFDLVHIRQGVFVSKNFNSILRDINRVLKPNGYIVVTEMPFEAYEGGCFGIKITSSSLEIMNRASLAEGVDIKVWQDMSSRLDTSHPLWENERMGAAHSLDSEKGPQATRGFYDITLRSEPVPLGAWHSDEAQKTLGNLMRIRALHSLQQILPAILSRGPQGAQTDRFLESLKQEIMQVERYRAFVMCRIWVARKR